MKNKNIGFGITGSFCTFHRILPVMEELAKENQVYPVLSPAAREWDTRFFKASEFRAAVEGICQRGSITTVVQAEPIGPKKMFDIMVIATCTGNTLAKLALGITDTPVLMAAKAHLRGGRPLVLAVSTNDALGAASRNIGELLCRRDVFFVPFAQDDPVKKPRSMVALLERIPETLEKALEGEQIQPIISPEPSLR